MIGYSNNTYKAEIDEEKCVILNFEVADKRVIGEKKMPLYEIQMRMKNGDIKRVSGYDGKLCNFVKNDNNYTVKYNSFKNADIEVTVSIKFAEDIKWRISVKNNGTDVIEWIEFPKITVINDLKYLGGKSKLLWGFNEGAIIEDIGAKEKHADFRSRPFEYPQEGSMPIFPGIVETQFSAYICDGFGLYMGAHDAEYNMKGIDFVPFGNSIYMQYRLFTGLDFGQDFEMNYDFVMSSFFGDWHDAAEIYRNWFEKNNSDFIKIVDNEKLPDWYKESPIVVTYPVRGEFDTDEMFPNKLFPYIKGMEHIERIAKATGSKIMVILMHWEGTAPWAPPFVWPPYGGEEALKEYIDALHKSGHLIGLYCSGLGYTIQSNLVKEYNKKDEFERENLSEVMCVSPKGELPLSKICTAQRSGYDLCPACQYTCDTLCKEVMSMANANVDYIQLLDQNHGGTSYFCYSRKHGHPPVPGKWQKEAVIALLRKLEEVTQGGGRKVLLGCESAAAEAYIPYLLFNDNRFNLNYRIGGYAVPVYSYIFHEYINNYMGNQVSAHGPFNAEKYPNNLILRIAYSFIAGDLITLVINQDGDVIWNWGLHGVPLPNQKNIYEYIKNANAIRKGIGKKYLQGGKMCKPLKILTEEDTVMELEGGYTCHFPKVFTSRWTAQDGSIGQIITNYNDEEVDIRIETDRNIVVRYNDEFSSAYKAGENIKLKSFQTVLVEQ